MNMIEVDPKLFITCRLCLDEMGQYQIVPKVQMQIKYCFEIDVQPFDGLPQLICKKCESILSQYAGIKQMYQVKQSNLKKKNTLKKSAEDISEEHVEEEEKTDVQQQQDTVSSSQQVETVDRCTSSAKKINKQKLSLTKRVRSVDCESSGTKNKERPSPIKATVSKNQTRSKPVNKTKKKKLGLVGDLTKRFVCRICSKYFSEKKNVISHINNIHEYLIMKYSSILNTHCQIKINKLGSALSLTDTEENVVLSKDKIINSVNAKYYIVYTSNAKRESASSESSDEEFIRNVGKYKRRRLISEDSNRSPVAMEQDGGQTSIDIEKQSRVDDGPERDERKSDSLMDCVDVDSDSASTRSGQTTRIPETEKQRQKLLYVNKKLIGNIITMCYKKYLKRFDNSKSVSRVQGDMDSFLRHKVLSVGTKTIHSKGLNSTGLLRYLEHKNLNVTWNQSKNYNSAIIVKTSLVNARSTENDTTDSGWRSLQEVDENHPTKSFIDIFENLPPQEISPTVKGREGSSRIDSTDNDIEKVVSSRTSPVTAEEINKKREKTNNDTYNRVQSTSVVSEASENAVLLLRTALESDKQTCKKILNANPVPYPKQLPTKKPSVHESPSQLKSPTQSSAPPEKPRLETSFVNFDEVPNMPVITSTVSLASVADEQARKPSNAPTGQNAPTNKVETSVPQIKVKPISELMPDKSVPSSSTLVNVGGWTVASSNPNDNMVLHTHSNLVYVANVPQYTSVTPQRPAAVCYPQVPCGVSSTNQPAAETRRRSDANDRTQRKFNQELVHMHTVELPNTKTSSPFRYFQRLLQIHNLVLLESTTSVSYMSTSMKCLIKFSLGFQQENNAPVTLCLTLYCGKNVFCVKVKDNTLKDIDVSKLSANWQWEILKVFKGDIANKLNMNALKYGLDMGSKINHFVGLLRAITFSKEK